MSKSTYNVLFLCTGNSARSILSEVILNSLGKGRFKAFSAGSFPTGKVNPFAIELLAQKGLPTDGLRSKSWDEFSGPDAPQMDFIFTVCDKAAGEQCPYWPGHPASAHWGFDDPAAVTGSDAEKRKAFERTFIEISARIRLFLALPLETIDRMSLQNELHAIGKTRAS
jgi:arsenate reductase (thioredoxin)